MPGFKYAAFISYSSRDRRFAARLQSKLKRYRIPKRFGDIDITGQGLKGLLRRIKPVFRDTEELSSGDLNAKLKHALDDSAALVVVCSPNSAKSRWVDKEIQHFIDQGRSDRIFAIIKSGIPNADSKQASRECLPASLRGSGDEAANLHVIAGDRRERVDGPKVAFLKVVAGIAGISFADLVDRDAKRARTTRIWSLGSFLGIMILSTFSLYQSLKDAHDNAVYGAFIEKSSWHVESMYFDAFVTAMNATEEAKAKAEKYTGGFRTAQIQAPAVNLPLVFSGNIKPDENEWYRTDTAFKMVKRTSGSSSTMSGGPTYASKDSDEFEEFLNAATQDGVAGESTLSVVRNELPVERGAIEQEIDAQRVKCSEGRNSSSFSRFRLNRSQFVGAAAVECHGGAFAASYTLVPKDLFPKSILLNTLRQIQMGLIAFAAAWAIFEAIASVVRALRRRPV